MACRIIPQAVRELELSTWGEAVPGPCDEEGCLARGPDLWGHMGKGPWSEAI